ncbi:MAG TPA: lipoprotein signal peptidase [Puia sp.]|nr:lipoprotein signal peptidase [Puia sp.]
MSKTAKPIQVILIVLLIIIADQTLKIWVKTHMPLSHSADAFSTRVSPYDNGIHVLGSKAQIYFVENEGMAMGMSFGGSWGKMALTLFRLLAVIFGVYYIGSLIKKKYHPGLIASAALIFAGALGNLIDSLFYGLLFEQSSYDHVARMFTGHGYAGFLHGEVVDMLYFPLLKTQYPSWFPFMGGKEFEFFADIFNIADASITVGVLSILVFQKRFFVKANPAVLNHSAG